MGAPKNDRSGVVQTFRTLTTAGYTVQVVDGEGEKFNNLPEHRAVEEVMSCDDGYFIAFKDGEQIGWVWFVFGNEPEEVICDHSTTLSHVLDPLTEAWWS